MFVYRGECRLCETGIATDIEDDCDMQLHTGDIVMLYSVTSDLGVVHMVGLTVIVANHYDNIQGLEPKRNDEKEGFFVMGIKGAGVKEKMEKYPETAWRVHLLKTFGDVIDGEGWKEYGFNYKNG